MIHESEALSSQTELLLMMVPLLLIIGVIYYAWSLYGRAGATVEDEGERSFVKNLIYRKFYVDELYETVIQKPIAKLSSFLHDIVELQIIDRFVNQTGNFVVWAGKNIRYVQTGNVGAYLFFMVVSIILILIFNLYK